MDKDYSKMSKKDLVGWAIAKLGMTKAAAKKTPVEELRAALAAPAANLTGARKVAVDWEAAKAMAAALPSPQALSDIAAREDLDYPGAEAMVEMEAEVAEARASNVVPLRLVPPVKGGRRAELVARRAAVYARWAELKELLKGLDLRRAGDLARAEEVIAGFDSASEASS